MFQGIYLQYIGANFRTAWRIFKLEKASLRLDQGRSTLIYDFSHSLVEIIIETRMYGKKIIVLDFHLNVGTV